MYITNILFQTEMLYNTINMPMNEGGVVLVTLYIWDLNPTGLHSSVGNHLQLEGHRFKSNMKPLIFVMFFF